jgi:uncharacterized protein (TIGR00255 family)
MLISMTGYGSGTASNEMTTVSAEIRSVNNRFYEFSVRLPKHLQSRENELKELIRPRIRRGKVNLSVSLDSAARNGAPMHVNLDAARGYLRMLGQLKEELDLPGEADLNMLLSFPDIFMAVDPEDLSEEEWDMVTQAVLAAVDNMLMMKEKEGRELAADLAARVDSMTGSIDEIERLSLGRADGERTRLSERIHSVLSDDRVDPERLELEIVLLADKMDITEELVRFRSHTKFFLETLASDESEGRKLSFLLQEMNREANTISAKSYDADISHIVVSIKEELERIREQIQNIE